VGALRQLTRHLSGDPDRKKHPGSISRVAQQSGVSRRRIWKLRDPELREKVVSVVAIYALKGEPP
jgi:hypothetical protein